MPTLRGGELVVPMLLILLLASVFASLPALSFSVSVSGGQDCIGSVWAEASNECSFLIIINFTCLVKNYFVYLYTSDGFNVTPLALVNESDGSLRICVPWNSITENLKLIIIKIILYNNSIYIDVSKNGIETVNTPGASKRPNTTDETAKTNTLTEETYKGHTSTERLLPREAPIQSPNPNTTILTRWLGLALIVASLIVAVIER